MTRVFETRDPARLRALLGRDPVAGAYLLGDLDPRYLGACRFFVAEAGDAAAVALVYLGLSVPALLTFGDAALAAALLADPAVALPATCHVHLPEAHREAVESRYTLEAERRMLRMALAPGALRPQAADGLVVRPLASADAPRLAPVYADYPGHFYEPSQLATGVYLGGFEGERLVTVAGTHVHAPGEGVCALGNIVTAADRRGRGYAAAAVSALVAAVRPPCEVVVLNVREANAPARACYRRVGFEAVFPYLEGRATRR